MKLMYLLATFAVVLVMMASCTRQSVTGYTLTAAIDGIPDGSHVQLFPVSHGHEKPVADTTVVDGKFIFKGVADEPLAVRLMVKNAYGSMPLMLENGSISVEGKVTSENLNGTVNYNFSQVSVTGSPLTDKYVKLLSTRVALDSIYVTNNEKFKDIRVAYGKARVAKDKILMDSVVATEAYKASAVADSLFFATVDATYYKLVMDNKESYWGPLMMISLFSYLTEEQKPWYDALSEEAKHSRYGKMVKESVAPDSQIGSKVPVFTAKSQDGKSVTLTDLCQGKKYVLIDFWASWCNPCRKEIPNLKKLYTQYADSGFQIVSISIDKKEAEWTKALKEEQLQWPNFLDTEGIADIYKVKFVPTMYLIDAQGVMVGENLRGEALANKLAELFGEIE